MSQEEYTTILGINHDFGTHTQILAISQCFYDVRKELEKQKLWLSSATPAGFRKRRNQLLDNVAKSVHDERWRRLVQPLIVGRNGIGCLNNYIVTCLTLTEYHVKRLSDYDLFDMFNEYYERIIGVVNILPDTVGVIDRAIEKKLDTIEDPVSQALKSNSISL